MYAFALQRSPICYYLGVLAHAAYGDKLAFLRSKKWINMNNLLKLAIVVTLGAALGAIVGLVLPTLGVPFYITLLTATMGGFILGHFLIRYL